MLTCHRHFASIGAAITLTALALDPFFQQTVRYNLKPDIEINSQAKSVAAYTYNPDNVAAGEFWDFCEHCRLALQVLSDL